MRLQPKLPGSENRLGLLLLVPGILGIVWIACLHIARFPRLGSALRYGSLAVSGAALTLWGARNARRLIRHDPGSLHRISAFTDTPEGGNPAGVWVGDALPGGPDMQRIAASIGYSETAFVSPARGTERLVRYFSPEAEVTFCGHATIAAGFVLGETEGDGTYRFATRAGEVPVVVRTSDGVRTVSLTSVPPECTPASETLVKAALTALGWGPDDLDTSIPPARAYAGAWHLVLAVAEEGRLAELHYDFGGLKDLMLREGLTTLQLVWRDRAGTFHSRNPFPVGGVVEDPATGAAAAALGGYLREARLITTPATIHIRQGEAIGRPSRLTVDIPPAGGIVVTGTAVPIPDEDLRCTAGERFLGSFPAQE